MLQSPAIFLQHAISASVIWGLGRHASAGMAVHTKTNQTQVLSGTSPCIDATSCEHTGKGRTPTCSEQVRALGYAVVRP